MTHVLKNKTAIITGASNAAPPVANRTQPITIQMPPAPEPQPITVNVELKPGQTRRTIQLQRDASGVVTGGIATENLE